MWRNSWTAEQNRLFSLQSEVNELPQARGNVLRVNQLDAVQLDNDLLSVLKVQFLKIFNASHGLDDRLMPEIDALLQLLVLHFTMFSDRPTPGNKLQNLHYQSDAALLGACCVVPHAALSVWQKLGYAAVVVGGRWAWARLRRYITALRWAECAENTWRKKFWRSAGLVENIFQVATLINLVVFLMQGRYRSLADRLLGLRLVYIQALTVRNVNFDFMNRQLVWHGFAEVVLFVLPLLNLTKVKNIIVRVFGVGGCNLVLEVW